MLKNIKRIGEIGLGILLIITGALLGFVAFIPGFPLGIIGILLISPRHGLKLLNCLENAIRAWLIKRTIKSAWKEFKKIFQPHASVEEGKLIKKFLSKSRWKKYLQEFCHTKKKLR